MLSVDIVRSHVTRNWVITISDQIRVHDTDSQAWELGSWLSVYNPYRVFKVSITSKA